MGKSEQAALLVAQDELSNEEIAKRAGITRQGLDKWKRTADFQEREDDSAVLVRQYVGVVIEQV